MCADPRDAWPGYSVLAAPRHSTNKPAPGQKLSEKCAAEYLGQHQPALQHCSTAAVDTCCSAYQMPTIFSGMEAMVAGSGQHKGGDCSCAHCSTAALQHCGLTQSPRPAALSTFLSIGRAKNCSSSQQLCSSLCGHCSTAALQLRLSTTKFREMFTIFLEGPLLVLSCPVHTEESSSIMF